MKSNLDKFYTKKEVAKLCYVSTIETINNIESLNEKDFFYIEPSVGNCDFFSLLPNERKIGIDISPAKEFKNIIKDDFLTWHHRQFRYPKNKNIVIGNPPFGKRGCLALKFIKKASDIADTIAFILPILFRKYLTQKNVPNDFSLIYDKKLPVNSFYTINSKKDFLLNSIFQVWTRLPISNDLRIRKAPPTNHPDIKIWQYNATKEAEKVFENKFDFAVLRQGYKGFNDKKYHAKDCTLKKQWMLFKPNTVKAKKTLMKIDFVKLAEKNTTSVKGFGKADVIEEYNRLNYGK